MDIEVFRRLALSFDGAEESAHMGSPDYRVGGRIFATLAMQSQGLGNLILSPEIQKALIAEAPEVFFPVKGGWGRMGITHVRLSEATERQVLKGLQFAWSLRVEKNETRRSGGSKGAPESPPEGEFFGGDHPTGGQD